MVLPGLFDADGLDALDWAPFRDGIEIHRLFTDGDEGPAAALLRYAPGASVPRHEHTGDEFVIVLSGSQTDDGGVYSAGTVVRNPKGSDHAVHSEDGCVVLVLWTAPVRFTARRHADRRPPP